MTVLLGANDKVEEVLEACESHGDTSVIVLSGVAGTGKSLVALAAAQRLTGHPLLVKEIQFHQGFSYEDFIEGFRPTPEGGFLVRDGIFLQVNAAATRDPRNRYALLIEELSRANVTAVFGELMTYLEHRERAFTTPITRRDIRVAPNLVVLGTMNPRDRSVLELDEAMFRRLRIIECRPDTAVLRRMIEPKLGTKVADSLANLFEEMERRHPESYSQLMPFGHGIFAHVGSEEDLRDLWHQRIKHFLYRPLTPKHRYAEDIEELYPWAGPRPSIGEVTAPGSAGPTSEEGGGSGAGLRQREPSVTPGASPEGQPVPILGPATSGSQVVTSAEAGGQNSAGPEEVVPTGEGSAADSSPSGAASGPGVTMPGTQPRE